MILRLKQAVTCLLDQCVWAMAIYRISHFFYTKNIPVIPVVLHLLGRWLTSIEIQPSAKIGKRVRLIHGLGTVIGSYVRIEDDVTILHQVTIGAKEIKEIYSEKDVPHVDQGVTIGAGAKILGGIFIGRNSVIGANSVVITDIAANTVAAGIPAKAIRNA